MTILEFFKTVHPSVLAAKLIFRRLHEHYPVLKISDIADTTSGGTPNRGMSEYYNGDIPWVKSGELKDGLISTCDEYITEEGLKNSSAKLFPKGTLLVAMYGANIGKTGVLDFDATTNQAVCAIFPKIDISKEYLYWFFRQQRIDFIAVGKGGAQPNISQTIINNASIVVPDEKVQEKIVKFLERIEKGDGIDYDFLIPEVLMDVETIYKYKNSYIKLSDSFETQLTQLENLNQAILQEAVQGKLVNQDPKDEPASELLKRIKAEKAKSGKKEKPLPPIKPEEIPFDIPENWAWCRLGEIAKQINDGTHHTPKYVKEGVPFLSIKDISGGKIDFGNTKFITREEHLELIKRCNPERNDILFCRIGTLGRPSIIETDIEFSIFVSLGLIKTYFNIYEVRYLKYLLESPLLYYQYQKIKADGIHTPKLNLRDVPNLLIPLPPLSEQKRIVAEIEKQFALTKQLKEHIIANQQATEQLLKALLHQAFEVKEMEEVNS